MFVVSLVADGDLKKNKVIRTNANDAVRLAKRWHEEHVNIRNLIRIRRLESYPKELLTLEKLKKYDVRTVRSARFMPKELMEDIETGLLK